MAGKSKRKDRDAAWLASQSLMKDRPEFDDSWKLILNEWMGEPPLFTKSSTPDRTVAIVLAAILEHALEHALLTHFAVPESEGRTLFHGHEEEHAPLTSFAAKIALGHALGIYEGMLRNELRWIKNIRNAFAHTGRHLDFETEEIATLVGALKTPHFVSWGGLIGQEPITPREKFVATVKLCFMYLAVDEPEIPRPKRFASSSWYQTIFLRQPKALP